MGAARIPGPLDALRDLIPHKDFVWVLSQLRGLRKKANKRKINPWAFRQALLTVVELDTETALETGITREQLTIFDVEAANEVLKFLGK